MNFYTIRNNEELMDERSKVGGNAKSWDKKILGISAQNNYFSSIVRIQADRGHKVCDTGLYKIVRHPGYLGMTVSLLSVPFITGSVWSFITTSVAVILLFVRTSLEDKTLIEELYGYKEYAKKTKYKLIPKVW